MKSIKTKIVHSETKDAWNVVCSEVGKKYKIARVPYITSKEDEIVTVQNKAEALEHAQFISYCFNNADKIGYGS